MKSNTNDSSNLAQNTPSPWLSVGICIFYGASSILVSMVNKMIFTRYEFNHTSLLLLIQSFASLTFISLVYLAQFSSSTIETFFKSNNIKLPRKADFKARFFPTLGISATNLVNISCGILALKYVTIPMFLTIRRLVAPCTLVVTIITTKKCPSNNIFYSIGLLTLGAIVAGFNDLQADYFGYLLTMLNNVFSVVYYQVLVFTSNKYKDLTFYEIYVFSTIQMIPILMVICQLKDEFVTFMSLSYKLDPIFILLIALACVLGVCVTISIQMCTIINSPIATTVAGNTKDTVGIIISIIIFKVLLNTFLVAGIVMSLTGAVLYSYAKYIEMKAKESVNKADITAKSIEFKELEEDKSLTEEI